MLQCRSFRMAKPGRATTPLPDSDTPAPKGGAEMLDKDTILRACKDPAFIKKFWLRVEKTAGCWNWTACCWRERGADRYGCVYLPSYCAPRIRFQAHRISWIITNGRFPDEGMLVCHACDNMKCCNPAHLHLGTQSQNIKECVVRGRYLNGHSRRTQCLRGHPFDEANTRRYLSPSGPRRICLACLRLRRAAETAARREASAGRR